MKVNKRRLRTLGIAVACLLLAVGGYAAVRLQHYGRHADKLWLHCCNSIEKYDESRVLYPNVEVDVVYRGGGLFDVTHDADTTFHLSLEHFLKHVALQPASGEKSRVWIDLKNLQPGNVNECLAALADLAAGSGVGKERLIVESPAADLLAAFTAAGFYTSCYVDAKHPSHLSDSQLQDVLGELRSVAASGDVCALSCPIWWYSTLRRHVPDIDLLTWAHRSTQVEFLLYPPGKKALNDPRLKVILLKKKGRFHR